MSGHQANKLDLELPESAYALIEQAASLCGVSAQSLPAMASLERALELLHAVDEIRSPTVVSGSQEPGKS